MSQREEEELRARAAKRAGWASRALRASSEDLYAAGATAAAEVIGEEADRVDQLAEEVRELAKVA
jgi:hypothetical protein